MTAITIIKLDHLGREVIRYPGRVLSRSAAHITTESFFSLEWIKVGGLVLARGDRMIETFYTDRWYNIFEVHDREDDRIKGWYCNIGHPAVITPEQVSYRDLALDLVVFPNGRQVLLDEDEFEALIITPAERQSALHALQELKLHFKQQTT